MNAPVSSWSRDTRSVAETVALGEAIGAHLQAGDLIALIGELGAGKTQFVRGLAKGLGVEDNAVASPTFVIAQEHPSQSAARPRLIHIDAYRIQKLDELESIGWEITGDTLGGELRQGSVVAIEWADRLDELVGSDRLEIRLAHQGEAARRVTVVPHGTWGERFGALVRALDGVLPQKQRATAASKCPICGKAVEADAATFPFCSKRCRTIDLGKWISGSYVISRPLEQRDLDEE